MKENWEGASESEFNSVLIHLRTMSAHLEMMAKKLEKMEPFIKFEDYEMESDDHNSNWGGAGPDCNIGREGVPQ